jgi:hypothetical protein
MKAMYKMTIDTFKVDSANKDSPRNLPIFGMLIAFSLVNMDRSSSTRGAGSLELLSPGGDMASVDADTTALEAGGEESPIIGTGVTLLDADTSGIGSGGSSALGCTT